MSSSTKRRVTVDTGNTASEDSEKRKPSVFERLGPGGGQRKYSEYDAGSSEREKKCRQFMMTGECPYGPNCKYKHVQLSRKSKSSREGEGSPEDMKLKFKGQQSERSREKQRRESDSGSPDGHGKSSSGRSRRDKETKIKSHVVVKKSSGNHGSDDSDASNDSTWFESLDYKKELELEQKRQQLQRELSQLEEDAMENITIQKKTPAPAHHPQSGSESSPDQAKASKRPSAGSGRGDSPSEMRSVSPGGKKKDKKKHRTRSPAEPDVSTKDKKLQPSSPGPSPDKGKEHRKKHEGEDESGHKKHKKNKKEKKHSLSPQPEPGKAKKKEKAVEDPEAELSRSQANAKVPNKAASPPAPPPPPPPTKHSWSPSSRESLSPQKPKEKTQTKSKSKKKKARGSKGEGRSTTTEGSTKTKKWLSPLTKTLKLKKAKSASSIAEVKEIIEEDEAAKRWSPTPQPSRSHSQEFLAEDPMPPSRHIGLAKEWEIPQPRGRSTEKRSKKHKNKRTPSPAAPSSDRGGRRGEVKQAKKRSGDHLHSKDSRKEAGEDKQKRGMVSPQHAELYSPSQLEHKSPARESVQPARSRHGESRAGDRGDAGRDEDRRSDREPRRGDKFDPRPQPSAAEHIGGDRYSRRGDGEGFDQHGQERSRYDVGRDARAPDPGADREQRGRGSARYERDPPARDRSRGDATGWDSSFDRQAETGRGNGGRDPSRDGRDSRDVPHDQGRERNHGLARDRSDAREARNGSRDASFEGSRFGMGTYPADVQRRGGLPWDGGNRSGDWTERPDALPDVSRDSQRTDDRTREGRGGGAGGSSGSSGSAGRIYRDDSREPRSGDRHTREAPVDSRQAPLDRVEGRVERGDSRLERDNRLDRSDSRLDRSDSRLDRSDSRGDRGEGRGDRADRSLDRGAARGDSQGDRRRGGRQASPFDQRGPRSGFGGAMSQSNSRGDLRGVGEEGRGYEYDRRLGPGREPQPAKAADRDSLTGRGGERDIPGVRVSDREGPGRNGDRELQMGRPGDRSGPVGRERDPLIGRPGDRDGQVNRGGDRLDRDREPGGMPRDRFVGRDGVPIDARLLRDDRNFPDEFPDPLHDRRLDQMDRYEADLRERDGRNSRVIGLSPQDSKLPKAARSFDDDRGPTRGSGDRVGRDRGMGRHDYDYDVRDLDPRLPPDLMHESDGSLRRLPVPLPRDEQFHRAGRGDAYESRGGRESGLRDSRDDRSRREPRDVEPGREAEGGIPSRAAREGTKDSARDGPRDAAWEGRESGRDEGRDFSRDAVAQIGRSADGRRARISPTLEPFVDSDRSRDRERERDRGDFRGQDCRRKDRSPRREGVTRGWSPSDGGDNSKPTAKLPEDSTVVEPEASRKQDRRESDRKVYDETERGRLKEEASDSVGGHLVDVPRDAASPYLRKDLDVVVVKERDSQSEGKRSPSRNRRREKSPMPFTRSSSADQRQAKRTRSLSPKQSFSQRVGSPVSVSKLAVEKPKSPTSKSVSSRSPSRRRGYHESESTHSPIPRSGQRGRSRTPVGARRKRGAGSRSPVPGSKDDTKSPVPKRLREESRSPTRRSSRHPSPAGSQHSHCSQGSLDRRRRPHSSYPEGDRYHRDSPARRDRDREKERERDRDHERDISLSTAQERSIEVHEEKDMDAPRKRGWSPGRASSRAGGHGDRGKRRRRDDGNWSDMDIDAASKEDIRQGLGLSARTDTQTMPDSSGDVLDMARSDSTKLLPPLVSSTTSLYPADASARADRRPGISAGGGRGVDDYSHGPVDGWGDRYEDRRDGSTRGRVDSVTTANLDLDQRGDMMHDAAEDSKDNSLSNILPSDEGYEEISSDEDDFANEDGEKQNQNNIVSVLEIDWASLAKEPVAKPTTGSLAKRFHPATVFHEIGISRSFAGDELFNKIKTVCERGIEDDTGRKEEVGEKSEDKGNKATSSQDTKGVLSLLHDVPALHLAAVRQRHNRVNLLKNVGFFRRGLCARRDLEIRRQLCKLDKVYEQPAVFPTHVMDTDLCKLSIQLFRQGRDYADRKNSECDIKGDLSI